jgi:hypothetical protein
MAQSPLELYEEAYRLQYHDKKIHDAVKVYEAIIRDFPDSNECAYSVIQLQKVKAGDITKALKKTPSGVYPLFILALMTSFFALLVALIGALLLFREMKTEQQRTTLAIAALSKMFCGDETNALKLLDEIKAISRRDALAFELSADIYRSHDQPAKAPPIAPPPTNVAETKDLVADDTQKVELPRTVPGGRQSTALKPRQRQAPAGVPSKRSPLIVNPDSVSYF